MVHIHGNKEENNTKNIRVAFILNVSFTLVEIIGGFFTNSVAILSDAIHDLGDSVTLGIAWYFQKISGKQPDRKYSYGYQRYTVMGALVSAIILAIGSSFIVYEAVERMIHPEEVEPKGMVLLSILGIVVNGLAVFNLKKGTSLNERVVALHLMEDVLGWIAVLIGSIVMIYWDIPIIDPILSILIALYILRGVYKNLKKVSSVILQRVPKEINIAEIKKFLEDKPEISETNDIHVWSLDGHYNIMTVNIKFDNNISSEEQFSIVETLHGELENFKIHHCTIERIK